MHRNLNIFAYPNRALLLPLIGLRIAEELDVKALALGGRYFFGDQPITIERPAHPIYGQAIDLLRKCKTDVNIAFVSFFDTDSVRKELRRQCDFDLRLKAK